jgi:hypothetical protein
VATKTGDWVVIAAAAADAREILRRRLLPDVGELVRIAGDGSVRDLALRIHDAAFSAAVALTMGLKGRRKADISGEGLPHEADSTERG